MPQTITFYIGAILAIMVFCALIFSLCKYRKRATVKGASEPFGIELIWTIIPILMVIALALPAIRLLLRHAHA